METNSKSSRSMTLVSSVVVGVGAVFALASAAAISQSAPTLRHAVPAAQIVRLDPVVVTVSKGYFDSVCKEEAAALARAAEAKKVTRG